MDAQFSNILRFLKSIEEPVEQEIETVDQEQVDYNNSLLKDYAVDNIEPEVTNEPDIFSNDIEHDTIENFVIPELEDISSELEGDIEQELEQANEVEDKPEVLCWRDTINFINSAKALSECLGDVLYNTEKWIGTISGYEEYSSNGMYHILGLTGTDGLIVTLEYTNLDNEVVYVTVTISNNNVTVVKVEKW